MEVPEILRSGDHGKVDRWRRAEALARTLERRPDLIEAGGGLERGRAGAARGPWRGWSSGPKSG